MSVFFNSVNKNGLESNTLKNKTLTMLLELILQFLSTKWISFLKDVLTEQIVFDIFTQVLQVVHNFILAVER